MLNWNPGYMTELTLVSRTERPAILPSSMSRKTRVSSESFPTLKEALVRPRQKKIDCFLGVEAVSDVKPLDGNHSDDCGEYFGRNTGFRGETYADCRSARPAVLLPILGVNYLTRFLRRSSSRVDLPQRLVRKVSCSQSERR